MKLHTNSKEFMSRCKSYFLDCIEPDGYDENPQTDKEKFQFVLDCFASEYGHEIEWKGEQVAFAGYLAGLPSCMTIEFYNWDIIQRAKLLGGLAENATEKEESTTLENWFGFMAFKFLRIAEKEGAKLSIEGAE